jgi:hypothetical protein
MLADFKFPLDPDRQEALRRFFHDQHARHGA